MPPGPRLGFVWKLAWREARASPKNLAMIALALGIGVACISSVRSVAAQLAARSTSEARQWLAADLLVRMGESVTQDTLDRLRRGVTGSRVTLVEEMPAMVAGGDRATALQVTLKAVDPDDYPFYGRLVLAPESLKLVPGTVFVSGDLLKELGLKPGSPLRVGGIELRIRGMIRSEPDRIAGPGMLGPRVLMTLGDLEASGLTRFGGAIDQRILIRKPDAMGQEDLRRSVLRILPAAEVLDSRDAERRMSEVLEWIAPLLDLIGFMAALSCAAAIAVITHLHLIDRMDSIATLRLLGARSGVVEAIYAGQISLLAALGGLLGLLLVFGSGWGFEGIRLDGAPLACWEGSFLGWFAAVGSAWLPLSQLGQCKPQALLNWRTQPLTLPMPRLAALTLATAYFASLFWLGRGPWMLKLLVGVSLPLAALLTALLMPRVFGVLAAISPGLGWRYAIEQLRRRPWRSASLVIAILCCAATAMTSAIVDRELGGVVLAAMPFGSPNLIFQHLSPSTRAKLMEALRAEGRAIERSEFVETVWLAPEGMAQRRIAVTCSHDLATARGLLPLLVDSSLALPPGAVLNFPIRGGTLSGVVKEVVEVPPPQRALKAITMPCAAFPHDEAIFNGGARVAAADVDRVKKSLLEKIPGLALSDSREFQKQILRTAGDALLSIRLIAILCAVTALFLLLAIVRVSRETRVLEFAILRTLGAGTNTLRLLALMEFGSLGAIGAGLGCLLGPLLSSLVFHGVTGIWPAIWHLFWMAGAIAGAALLTGLSAVVSMEALIRKRPLDALRRI